MNRLKIVTIKRLNKLRDCILLIEKELKYSLVMTPDEKNKSQFYIERIKNYFESKNSDDSESLGKSVRIKMVYKNVESIKIKMFGRWYQKLIRIYKQINWNVDLSEIDIDIKLVKKYIDSFIQHLNKKKLYLMNIKKSGKNSIIKLGNYEIELIQTF